MLGLFRRIRQIKRWTLFNSRPFNRYSNHHSEEELYYSEDEVPENPYETMRKEEFTKMYSTSYTDKIPGYASPEGTKAYFERNSSIPKDTSKHPFNSTINLSSIGVGTYLGENDEIDDLKMFNAIIDSVQSGGVNVIDTAINYRGQKSERTVGAAMRYLLQQGYSREGFFISSKNGYLTDDADTGESSQVLSDVLLEKGIIKEEDIIAGYHCIHPSFLELQLERSLSNIGIQTLDLYYLHNVSESQLLMMSYQEMLDGISRAFEFCEKKVHEGKIKTYGMATWVCFRSRSDQDKLYVGLQDVAELAQKVGGKNNNFRYIQLPYNFVMIDSFFDRWQKFKENNETSYYSIFELAEKFNINIMTSVPLAQGRMLQYPLSTEIFQAPNSAAEHLQLIRSTPSKALITTLVGHKTSDHVKSNLDVLQYPRLSPEQWLDHLKLTKANFN